MFRFISKMFDGAFAPHEGFSCTESVQFNVNGQKIKGRNIQIVNGQVTVDGKRIDSGKELTLIFEGNVEKLTVDHCARVEIKGSITGNAQTMSGDIECADIGGDVSTMSGDVKANEIKGSVSTMSGDIRGARK